MMGGTAPWWMAGGAVAAAILLKAVDWFFQRKKSRTETDANVELLNSMRDAIASHNERLRAMEVEQASLRQKHDEEIRLRMAAQEEAHRLRLRVLTLEQTLRGMGAVIPPEPHA